MPNIQEINEKKQKRASLIAEMRAVNDLITTEKRALSSEETAQIGRIESDIATLDGEIRSLETTVNLQKRFAENVDPVPGGEATGEKRESPLATAEYRTAFLNKMLHRDYDARALSIGAVDNGADLVPTDFMKLLINDLRDYAVLRRICTVKALANDAEIPNVTGHSTAAWGAEAEAFNDTSATFDKKALGAYKMTALTKVSDELLADSAIDVTAFLAQDFAEAFGTLEDSTLLAEARVNATKSPNSIVATLTGDQAKSTATAGAITFDDIITLEHAVKAAYRNKAAFLMGDATAVVLRKLKDNDNQYLWQPSVQAGQPDMIHGKAINYTDALGFTSGSAAVLFGDFSRIWIADRGQMSMKRLNEIYAVNGQVGFIGYRRMDAVLTVANAMAKLTIKSA